MNPQMFNANFNMFGSSGDGSSGMGGAPGDQNKGFPMNMAGMGVNPAMFGGIDMNALVAGGMGGANMSMMGNASQQQQSQQQQQQQQPQQQAQQQLQQQQPQQQFNAGMLNPALLGMAGNGGIDLQALQRAAAASGINPAAFNPQLFLQQQQQHQRQGTPQQQQQQQPPSQLQGQPSQQQAQQQNRWPQQQGQQQGMMGQMAQMAQMGQMGQLGQIPNGGGIFPGQLSQNQAGSSGGQINPAAFGINPQAMAQFGQMPMQAMQGFGMGQGFPQNGFGQQQQQQPQQATSQPNQAQNMFAQAQSLGHIDPNALFGGGNMAAAQNMLAGMSNNQGQQMMSTPMRPNSAVQPNGIPSYLQTPGQQPSPIGQQSPMGLNQQQQQGTPQTGNSSANVTPPSSAKPKPPRKKAEKKATAGKPQTPILQNAAPPSISGSPSSISGVQGANIGTAAQPNMQALAFERSRSHTRSPSVSLGGPGTPSQMHAPHPATQNQQQPMQPMQPQTPQGMQQQQQQPPRGPPKPNAPMPSPIQQVVPPNWNPSLNPQQQQAILSRALALAKAQEGTGITPVHTLMQMGYLFLKASSLPGGQHPSMMPNGGMVLTINEARGLGLIPAQGGPGQPGQPVPGQPHQHQQQPQQQQQPQHQQPQQQQLPGQPGMVGQPGHPVQLGQPGAPMPPQAMPQTPQRQFSMSGQGQMFGGPAPGQPGAPMTPQQPNPMMPPGMMAQFQQQPQQPQQMRPMTPAAQHASPGGSVHAQSPAAMHGSTSSPALVHQQRPRQPSASLSASGRPDSRSGPIPGAGLMAPPPAPGHLPPGGSMPSPFGMMGSPHPQDPAAQAQVSLAKQGRRPSMADHNAAMSPTGRRPSMADGTGMPQPNGVNPAFENLPLTDPALAAAGAAPQQAPAQAHAMNQGMLNTFGPPGATPRRPSQPVTPQGQPSVEPPHPQVAGMPAQPAPQGNVPAPQPNLSNLPMVKGGPAPRESAAGTPITPYNTRMTRLPTKEELIAAATKAEEGGEGKDKDREALPSWSPLTEEQEKELLSIMKRDKDYEALYRKQQINMEKALKDRIDAVRPPRRKISDGTITRPKPLSWWERPEEEDVSGLNRDGVFEPFRILLPSQKRTELEQGQRGARPIISLGKKQMDSVSSQGEDLVPIRLEIDHEHWKLRDTFTWNALDSHINVEAFAQSICEDIGLPAAVFVPAIKEQIQSQISDHLMTNAVRPRSSGPTGRSTEEGDGKGSLEDKDQLWWSKWRHRVETNQFTGKRKRANANGTGHISSEADEAKDFPVKAASEPNGDAAALAPTPDQVAPEDSATVVSESDDDESEPAEIADMTPVEELRMIVKLDITVGSMNLVDQFEWDANETDPTAAEKFAETFAADLGLPGEFKTAIAHSIREQVHVHIKSLAMMGHGFDGRPIADDELRMAFLPLISKGNTSRGENEADAFTPKLLQLSEAEIERLDREREREARRKRRQTRGRRGINLPDREPQKTQRTPAVYGIQIANAGDASANGFAVPAYGAGMSTRRAAAAAANASIAPSQVSDFGTPTPQASDAFGLPDRKKPKVNNHATHFLYPGGLGRKDGPNGPIFSPDYTEEEARKRARSPDGHATAQPAPRENAAPSRTSQASYAARNNVRPEDLERQHPNIHDGMWHCSNCGIPGTLAPGRRKGPLGDKSLCGPCGKYYHRHRKVLIVDYTRDFAFHMKQQQATIRKGTAANALLDNAIAAMGEQEDSTEPTSAADTPKPEGTDSKAMDEDTETEPVARAAPAPSGRRIVLSRSRTPRAASPDLPFELVGSPDDSDSSRSSSPEPGNKSADASESIKAEDKSGMDGGVASEEGELEQGEVKESGSVPPTTPSRTHATIPVGLTPPDWLQSAAVALRARYPNDRFETQPRPRAAGAPAPSVPEWRVRCLDCPGKLYTPGPGESLTNFEIHLRNRHHRANVNRRVYGGSATSPPPGGSVGTPGSAQSPTLGAASVPPHS